MVTHDGRRCGMFVRATSDFLNHQPPSRPSILLALAARWVVGATVAALAGPSSIVYGRREPNVEPHDTINQCAAPAREKRGQQWRRCCHYGTWAPRPATQVNSPGILGRTDRPPRPARAARVVESGQHRAPPAPATADNYSVLD